MSADTTPASPTTAAEQPTNQPEPAGSVPPRRPIRWLSGWIGARAGYVVVAAIMATGVLAIPMLAMAPDQPASQDPDGPIFDARDTIDERFGAQIAEWTFIVESPTGDLLDRENLTALHRGLTAVRDDPDLAPLLLDHQISDRDPALAGTIALPDAVDQALRDAGHGGLATADDRTVADTVARIIDDRSPRTLGLSTHATRDASTGRWSAPAITISLTGDRSLLADHPVADGADTTSDQELVGRQLQVALSEGDLDVFGVAIDQGLTAQEQGQAAGPFIGLTILTIVLLTGIVFRSYLTLTVIGGALLALLVWLQGLSNLFGLKDNQILATVVPIAMIAFGIDYAFHAVSRYREEQHAASPRAALARGLTAVSPALLLALATGVVAFAANTASGIEAIVQFGIAASLALVSAFLLLGIAVPAALALIDQHGTPPPRRGTRTIAVIGSVLAAGTAMATALLLVFIAPAIGVAALAAYLAAFVIIPGWVRGRRTVDHALTAPPPARQSRVPDKLAAAVVAVAARRRVVLPAVGAVSTIAALAGLQVPASFDVEDFFAPDTGFVEGLDRIADHTGESGGERAEVLVTTDLSDPAAIGSVEAFADRITELDTDRLAQQDGQVAVDRRALDVLADPASAAPLERARLVAEPDGTNLGAAVLGINVVGSRAQENVEQARELLEPFVSELADDLQAVHPGSTATLTGTPIVRQASLDGVARSLRVSVPIALLLCLLMVWIALRSLRYALVSVVPIVLVVAWLHGFMYVAGFSLNLVTATIGAISIGIGIDLAVHLTMRFREELHTDSRPVEALRTATRATGVALAASAATSTVGFAILAFAPMPMFASYGLLTAVMIVLALFATLTVLPALLLTVTPRTARPHRSKTATN